jgi:hypothetical protein
MDWGINPQKFVGERRTTATLIFNKLKILIFLLFLFYIAKVKCRPNHVKIKLSHSPHFAGSKCLLRPLVRPMLLLYPR